MDRLKHLENLINWLLNIPNEYNRRRLISDEELLKFIDEKLRINEEYY